MWGPCVGGNAYLGKRQAISTLRLGRRLLQAPQPRPPIESARPTRTAPICSSARRVARALCGWRFRPCVHSMISLVEATPRAMSARRAQRCTLPRSLAGAGGLKARLGQLSQFMRRWRTASMSSGVSQLLKTATIWDAVNGAAPAFLSARSTHCASSSLNQPTQRAERCTRLGAKPCASSRSHDESGRRLRRGARPCARCHQCVEWGRVSWPSSIERPNT